MKRVAIVGFGRFGELLCDLLAPNHSLAVVESNTARRQLAKDKGYSLIDITDIGACDVVVFAVPISAIEEVVAQATQCVTADQLVMDICSVKVYPVRVMRQMLSHCQIIATHPMFGPDSASKGLEGLQVAICPIRASDANVEMVVSFWQKLGVEVLMTTPEAHDKDAAYSQAFTYSIAKLILGVDVTHVRLTTRSFNAIAEVARLSANDSPQLFHDMLYYNPYFASMKAKLTASMEDTRTVLQAIEDEQSQTQIFGR